MARSYEFKNIDITLPEAIIQAHQNGKIGEQLFDLLTLLDKEVEEGGKYHEIKENIERRLCENIDEVNRQIKIIPNLTINDAWIELMMMSNVNAILPK